MTSVITKMPFATVVMRLLPTVRATLPSFEPDVPFALKPSRRESQLESDV